MPTRRMFQMMFSLAVTLTASPGGAAEPLTVLMSGGFALAYRAALPEFERDTGIAVTTLSGASQGTGPQTVKAQLERGVDADVVILSENGLNELVGAGRVLGSSRMDLARVPLGAAVRQGSAKPEIGTVEALKRTLLNARLLVMPGSTSGLFMTGKVFPQLAIADRVNWKTVSRGTDATGMLAAGEADLAIGPLSELVDQPGVELVGALPREVQLHQVFAAATVGTARHPEAGKRLIDFLASDRASAAIRRSGMEPVGSRPTP